MRLRDNFFCVLAWLSLFSGGCSAGEQEGHFSHGEDLQRTRVHVSFRSELNCARGQVTYLEEVGTFHDEIDLSWTSVLFHIHSVDVPAGTVYEARIEVDGDHGNCPVGMGIFEEEGAELWPDPPAESELEQASEAEIPLFSEEIYVFVRM